MPLGITMAGAGRGGGCRDGGDGRGDVVVMMIVELMVVVMVEVRL